MDTSYLASARMGDNEAFNALIEPHRKPLLVHCYRMSGSLDDAEDLVQETFIRAWDKLNSYQEQGSFRNWLYVIATRLWLDEYRKRKKQVLLPLDGSPADPDSPPQPPMLSASYLDPLPDSWLNSIDQSPEIIHETRENISFAFIVALQKLNAKQRIVLILREVFNWSAEEVSTTLELTIDSVNNLLYRARKNLNPVHLHEPTISKQYLNKFVTAWEAGDIHSLIQLLNEKSTFAMPPMGVWYAGGDSIQRALQNFVFVPNVKWKLIPTSANGNPAFGIYRSEGKNYHAFGLLLLTFENETITEVIAFLYPQLIKKFGLEESIL